MMVVETALRIIAGVTRGRSIQAHFNPADYQSNSRRTPNGCSGSTTSEPTMTATPEPTSLLLITRRVAAQERSS